jgi:hypothetical protein
MACALVARGLHQDLRYIKRLPLDELYMWAAIAAPFEGRKFE